MCLFVYAKIKQKIEIELKDCNKIVKQKVFFCLFVFFLQTQQKRLQYNRETKSIFFCIFGFFLHQQKKIAIIKQEKNEKKITHMAKVIK